MKKVIKGLVLIVAFFAFTMTFTNTAYAKKNYTVSPKKLTKEVKKSYGRYYTKYIKDFSGLNLYLEKMQKAGGGTLTIKKGTYKITNAIYVPSNVTIIFEDGVVFQKLMKTGRTDIKATTSMWNICPRNKGRKVASVGKYNGSKNVKFIAKGKVVFDMKGVGGVAITSAHNKNVEISGITFRGMNGGHYIEVNGTNKAYIHDCTFEKAKASTLNKNYVKEAINIDLADKKTGGLSAQWVKQDKTPCKNIRIANNVFDGMSRGVGSHKYSQNSKGKNIYHQKITIENNTFKNNFDNGIYVLSWKDVVIKNNYFENIGNKSKKSYSAGSHGISGSGMKTITITGNTFKKIKRNPIYFIKKSNVGSGSEYNPVFVNITESEAKMMCNNTAIDCGDDINSNYAGYDVLYFVNDGSRSRENGVGVKFDTKEVFFGIPKN